MIASPIQPQRNSQDSAEQNFENSTLPGHTARGWWVFENRTFYDT